MQPHDSTPQGVPLKQCSICKEFKPATLDHFSCHKKSKDGLRSWCKPCCAESSRAYQVANRERIAAYREANKERIAARLKARYEANKEREAATNKAYREANRERKAVTDKAYREANPERMAERNKVYREVNAERIAASKKAWSKANPNKKRSSEHRRRAHKTNAGGTHTAADITRQYKAQYGKCYWCGVKVGKTYHIDHIVPLSRGGSDDPENLVVSCPDCNVSKGAKLPSEWPQGGRLL